MDEKKTTRRRKKSADEQIEGNIAALDETIETGAAAAAAAVKETDAAVAQAADAASGKIEAAAEEVTDAVDEVAGDLAQQAEAAADSVTVETPPVTLPEPLFPLPHSDDEPRKQRLSEMIADDAAFDADASSDDRVMAALAYASQLVLPLGFIFPAILLASETSKNRPFLHYHAVQSLAVGVIIWGLGLLYGMLWATTGGLLALCLCCVLPLGIALWLLPLYYAVLAYNGKRFRIAGLTQLLRDQKWL